jgi:hypothetical protein
MMKKQYVAFVSHHKTNSASGLAVIIKKAMESKKSSQRVFLDQEQGHLDLTQIFVHLEQSKTVVLLLTKDVLHRPYCLLELNHAISHKIPNIIAKPYNFKDAEGIREAQLAEFWKGINTAQFNEIADSKERWLAERSTP